MERKQLFVKHVCTIDYPQSCLKIVFGWWGGWDPLAFQSWAALYYFYLKNLSLSLIKKV